MSINACQFNGNTKRSAAARHSKQGFTLTEIAIVLGIIGLILGAIWVAAASVYSNLRVSKGVNQVLAIAQSTRALYATSPTTGDAAGTNETASFISAGVFPADMINGGATVNPFNGTVMVTTQTNNVAGDAFGIEYNSVPTAACISMLTSTGGVGRDSGLIYANASAAAKGAASFGVAGAGSLAFPVVAGTAAGASACAAGTAVSVQWVFKLKG